MFVDEAKVKLRAGDGGDGCMSFRREKYIPEGGPDGGDGGRGGKVILQCDENVSDLTQYYYKGNWEARRGLDGMGRQKKGANGADCILKVPPGTVVVNTEDGTPIAELLQHGQEHTLLVGGAGGLGNLHFKSSTNQSPRQTTEGTEGQQGEYTFILKTIADIGLVGFPNAGKSTLLSALTQASPKAAAYPFTTLYPVVGIMEYEDTYERVTLADIPGLIEGAHENKGLGHRFLRHIERCKGLLFLIDMAGLDGRDPVEDFHTLRNELKQYDPGFLQKPYLIAANKMDEPSAADNLLIFRQKVNASVLPISGLLEEGLLELRAALYKLTRKA